MSVKSSYRGMVRVINERSKYFQRVSKMEESTWRDGTQSGVMRIEGKRVYIALSSLQALTDDEAKDLATTSGVGYKQGKLTSLVQIVKTDGKVEFTSPMTDSAAMDYARKHKIENTDDTVAVWKMSGYIANPRVIADFISA